jgi:adenylate cyclase
MTISEAAAAVGVSTETLRRWVREGVVPEYNGDWSASALGNARMVARLRQRGYTLMEIKVATQEGRLAFGRVLALFEPASGSRTIRQAARQSKLDVDTVTQVAAALGIAPDQKLDATAILVLGYVASGIRIGMPVEAMLQITRIYAQAISQIADAEVRLVHLYLHEPLMRSGGPADEMAGELLAVAEGMLPLTTQLLDQLHQRMLLEFIEQDIVGHMEGELTPEDDDVGRMLVAVAFADLAGYTEMTEREGDQHALDVVEAFLQTVTATLPDDARVIKTIGDEVMIVGADPIALAGWALTLDGLLPEHPRPRAAVHYGYARYRDGDYYGREVNLAARVQAESREGEVLVTRAVVEMGEGELRFEPVADILLRGFSQSTELYRVLAGARS